MTTQELEARIGVCIGKQNDKIVVRKAIITEEPTRGFYRGERRFVSEEMGAVIEYIYNNWPRYTIVENDTDERIDDSLLTQVRIQLGNKWKKDIIKLENPSELLDLEYGDLVEAEISLDRQNKNTRANERIEFNGILYTENARHSVIHTPRFIVRLSDGMINTVFLKENEIDVRDGKIFYKKRREERGAVCNQVAKDRYDFYDFVLRMVGL